jgi:hypothetical protein
MARTAFIASWPVGTPSHRSPVTARGCSRVRSVEASWLTYQRQLVRASAGPSSRRVAGRHRRSPVAGAGGEHEVDGDSEPRVDAQLLELVDLGARDVVREFPGSRRHRDRLERADDESDGRDEPMASCREERQQRQRHGCTRVASNTARVASRRHDRRDGGQHRAANPQRGQRESQRPMDGDRHAATTLRPASASASRENRRCRSLEGHRGRRVQRAQRTDHRLVDPLLECSCRAAGLQHTGELELTMRVRPARRSERSPRPGSGHGRRRERSAGSRSRAVARGLVDSAHDRPPTGARQCATPA